MPTIFTHCLRKGVLDIDLKWERVKLEKLCTKITDGTHKTPKYTNEGIPFLRVTDLTGSSESKKYISKTEHKELIKRCNPEIGDILYSKNGTIGVAKLIDWDWEFSIFVSLALLKINRNLVEGKYLELFLNSEDARNQASAHSKSGTVTNLHLVEIKQMQIPLPSLVIQRQIVENINAEKNLVEANKELIKIYDKKINFVLSKLYEHND